MAVQPDPERWAEANRWAATRREAIPSRNWDANRMLAFDVLQEFAEGSYDGTSEQFGWALLWAERCQDPEEHEAAVLEQAWDLMRRRHREYPSRRI